MKHLSCALLLSALVASPALAWGYDGHRTVAHIALLKMKPETARKVLKLLPERDLAEAAVWPDEVRRLQRDQERARRERKPVRKGDAEQETFLRQARNRSNGNWHYVNLPLESADYPGAIPNRPEGFSTKEDVVRMTNACIAVLRPGSRNTRFTKAVALRYLAHLVGDMHQPLHVGAQFLQPSQSGLPSFVSDPAVVHAHHLKSDLGGNLLFYASTKNLHALWDTGLVEPLMSGAGPKEFAAHLVHNFAMPEGTLPGDSDIDGWARAWASDTLKQAAKAYEGVRITGTRPDGGYTISLGDAESTPTAQRYRVRSAFIARDQLIKAGYRLAALLDALYGNP